MPQDSHAQTAAKREKCDSRKPFATAPTRRHLAGLAIHTARVSGEPWLRTAIVREDLVCGHQPFKHVDVEAR